MTTVTTTRTTTTDTDLGYRRWRASIPFSDAAIAAALRDCADSLAERHAADTYPARWRERADFLERTGRLSSYIYTAALPYLVKVCALCGRTALYRYGASGRCKVHRLDAPPTWVRHQRQFDERQQARAAQVADTDRRLAQHDRGRHQKRSRA